MEHVESSRLNEQGVACLQNRQFDQAHAKFAEALKQDPQNADTLYNLASTYQRNNQPREAERYYKQALQINPNHAACRHNYYVLLVDENREIEAKADAEKYRSQHPDSADALAQCAWLTRLSGDLPAAQKQLEQALALEPKNPEALLEMGKLYQDLHMPVRAKGLYGRVLEVDPQNEEAGKLMKGVSPVGVPPSGGAGVPPLGGKR
jgi:type IV pilus assembly protein PilF